MIVSFYVTGQVIGKETHSEMNTRSAAYAAYLSGFLAILSALFLILFFWLEAPSMANAAAQQPHGWGPLSDICPIGQMLALLVVAHALYRIERSGAPSLSLVTYLIGMVGMLGVSILQLLLIMGLMPFEQEVGPVLIATAVVGVWLILVNYLGRRQAQLPARLAWLGMGVGLALILQPWFFSVIGGGMNWRNMMSNPLLLVGSALIFVMSYAGLPSWLFWLGRTLINRSHEYSGRAGIAIAHAD
jgi:hypothetical protein